MSRIAVARVLALLSLGLALSSLAGCILSWPFRETDPRGLAISFSHRIHIEEDLYCEDCHQGAEDADEAGMPGGLGACNLCHGEIDADKPDERRLHVYLRPDGTPWWSSVTRLSDDVIFSHRAHYEAEKECEECHHGMETSDAVDPGVRVTKDECYACHTEQATDCEYCHKEIRKDWAPPSHRRDWMRQHGIIVRNAMHEDPSERCGLCHQQNDCDSCHRIEEPRNHTNYWRLRGHGVAAAMDRERCATCHQTDICQRCHSSTRPRDHVPTFGSTMNTHCLKCHAPVSSERCGTCHTGTPSHAFGTPKPAWHTPGMNCRQCHGPGLGAPMPHVDNGDDCNQCHP